MECGPFCKSVDDTLGKADLFGDVRWSLRQPSVMLHHLRSSSQNIFWFTVAVYLASPLGSASVLIRQLGIFLPSCEVEWHSGSSVTAKVPIEAKMGGSKVITSLMMHWSPQILALHMCHLPRGKYKIQTDVSQASASALNGGVSLGRPIIKAAVYNFWDLAPMKFPSAITLLKHCRKTWSGARK